MDDMKNFLWKHMDKLKAECEKLDISYEQLIKCPRSYNKGTLWFLHYDPDEGKNGLLDESPAKVLMKISREGEIMKFETAEDIKEYL